MSKTIKVWVVTFGDGANDVSMDEWRRDLWNNICPGKVVEHEISVDAHGSARSEVVIDTCDHGHRFAKLPDHPMRDRRPRCPHCLAAGLDAVRASPSPAASPSGVAAVLEQLRLEAADDRFHDMWQQGVRYAISEVSDAIASDATPPGWSDPLESPQAEAIRAGKIDDTSMRDLFDQMERELKEHRARAASDATPDPTSGSEDGGEAITARYTNWQGVTAERTFIPHRVFFGSNEWHPEPQVLIEATDCEKGALRTFAVAGFAHPAPATVEAANKAEAILRQCRRFIAAEHKHAERGERGEDTTRDDVDFEHTQLVGDFTVSDCDEALRLVKRRRAALAPATEGRKG